jgi:3-hydroxyisobutyrate dehydrogenase-like beta-hydroxyacid dehydrogenase
MRQDLTLIGYGEAGRAFARAARWGSAARVFDCKTNAPVTRRAMIENYAADGVTGTDSVGEALGQAKLTLSLVTADQALIVARDAAMVIAGNALFFDMNSVAPDTKRAAAAVIDSAGGRYIDVAIMAPVNPAHMNVPLFLSGPDAADGSVALRGIGFTNIRIVGNDVGRASTIKMLRSVMYKGMEALTAECLIACESAGVTDEVLGSFGNDWASGADYRLDRMMAHGLRRAAEMEEVMKTLAGLGVEPLMTRGTVMRQRAIGALGVSPVPETLARKLEVLK